MKRPINPKALMRVAGGVTIVGQLLVVAADRAVAWAKGYEKGYEAALTELGVGPAAAEGPMFAMAAHQLRDAGHSPELVVDEKTESPRFICTRCSSSWAPGDEISACTIEADVADPSGPVAGDG